MNKKKIKVGIIGFGRMGEKYLGRFHESDRWSVAYICDVDDIALKAASELAPEATLVTDEDVIFSDLDVDVVVLSTLANLRMGQIKKAVKAGKHIISEKPIADSVENEWAAVRLTEEAGVLSTVNLYLRNSWYHKKIKRYIEEGEIGELAIIRVCHMTPGLAPGEGHEYEGPAFHDCGMHYVDIARWYAGSEYKTWNSQGLRMWSYEQPWWVQCHGTFENGVVFDITQGFVYGQLSKNQTHNSYVDIIGTKGIVRMTHDFKSATVDLHGVTKTELTKLPFGEKNIDVICSKFADSIENGELSPELPRLRDSAIASEYADRFYQDALTHDLPCVGSLETLDEIRHHRANLEDGYGLLGRKNRRKNNRN